MAALKSFSPEHLAEDAKRSGFFHCPRCGLFWFGRPEATTCPQGPHGKPVHVALICRTGDAVVSLDRLAAHLDASHLRAN